MSANKPKPQEENRKPGQDQDELGKGRTPGEPSEQQYDQGVQDKDKNKKKGGDFQTR
ncbi:MAG: hypothetical protein AABO41_24120 [Acidobacteriota bacterium]